MAAWTGKGDEVDFNGTGEVVLVSAPTGPTAPRTVSAVTVKNRDSVAHGIKIRKKKAATYTDVMEVAAGQVLAGQYFPPLPGHVTLDATDETLVGELTEAMVTTQPRADIAYFEYSP